MRKLTSEALGTALLLAAVIGSGIMGDRLSQGNVAIALLANTLATGATLVAPDSHIRSYLRLSLESSGHTGRRYFRRPPVERGARCI